MQAQQSDPKDSFPLAA